MNTDDDRKGEPADLDFRAWFNKQLDIYIRAGNEVYAQGKEHLPFIFAFQTKRGPTAAIPLLNVMKELNIDAVSRFQRALALNPAVYAVVFVIEAWTVLFDNMEMQTYPHGDLSKHPKRTEALIINAIHKKQQLMAKIPINRQTKKLEEPQIIDPIQQHSEGRMILNRPTRH